MCISARSIIRAPNLKGLRDLDLTYNSSLSDATMAAIANNLTALTRLSVRDTAVTAVGKQHVLAALPGLKMV